MGTTTLDHTNTSSAEEVRKLLKESKDKGVRRQLRGGGNKSVNDLYEEIHSGDRIQLTLGDNGNVTTKRWSVELYITAEKRCLLEVHRVHDKHPGRRVPSNAVWSLRGGRRWDENDALESMVREANQELREATDENGAPVHLPINRETILPISPGFDFLQVHRSRVYAGLRSLRVVQHFWLHLEPPYADPFNPLPQQIRFYDSKSTITLRRHSPIPTHVESYWLGVGAGLANPRKQDLEAFFNPL